MKVRGRQRDKSIREREQGREGEKGKEERVEGKEKEGLGIRRGRGEFLKEIVISKGNLFTKRQTNGNQMVWTGWVPWYSLGDFKGPYSSFVLQVNQ